MKSKTSVKYLKRISERRYNFFGSFADDTCLLTGAPSINILENQLKEELNSICNWISANNLTLNSKKNENINYFTKPQVFKCCFKYSKFSW